MKLLDYALIGLLSGATPTVFGQADAVPPAAGSGASPHCTQAGCRDENDGLLFQIRTRGDRDATSGTVGDAALQPDRRVTVQGPVPASPQPGRASAAGKFSVQLPDGGIIWATEDPTLGQPELNISAPGEVAFENGRLTQAVPFYLRTNYPSFIRRFEVRLYRASDTALVEPLAQLDMHVAAVSRVEWQGELTSRFPLRTGDELMYVLFAYGANGEVDETLPRSLKLVRPEDAERTSALLRDSVERGMGTALTTQQAQTQRLVDEVFASSELRQQNIAIYGSRIRIQGRNLPEESTLLINGESYPTDLQRKFVAEFLEPVGTHNFDLVVKTRDQLQLRHQLSVDVTGEYFFGVGIADLTAYRNKATGPGREMALAGREKYALADGRLAFYGKAKLQGKYLVTAHADTQERDIGRLFNGFLRANEPRDVFRRLDPDQYYLTYGDDSSTVRDVDTQGRLYLRVDWDKNQALWGNFVTGITGTEYAQYTRSLYGAALKWRSSATNPWGEPRTQVRAFASDAQTAPGHSEFLGTGGSLYYLRHTDILPGSEQVVVEVRNPTTGSIVERRTLQRGVDYEMSDLQGRLILTRPLMQFAGAIGGGITRDGPTAGMEQRLLVDYEWIPRTDLGGNLSTGLRGKQWMGDHVGIGGTYVNEERAGQNYELKGVDLTLRAHRGTYLRLERSESQATGAPVFFSTNGGFTFDQLNAVAGSRSGGATALEAQANFRELGWTERNWDLGAWWRDVDAGFSVAREDIGVDRKEYGVELRGQISDTLEVHGLQSRATRGAERLDQTQVTAQWRPTEDHTVTAELRRITQNLPNGQAVDGTLGAVKYGLRLSPSLDVYGIAQYTLDDDNGRYADNDALTVGGRYTFSNQSVVGAELTHGDRGDAAQLRGEYKLAPDHTVYGTFTHTTDTSDYDSLFNQRLQSGWTLGQRWRVGERTNVFNEAQFLKEPQSAGLVQTFGLDFYPAVGWSTGFTLQHGNLELSNGLLRRRAASVGVARTSPDTEWSSRLEWREDSGVEQRRQWVTTNRLNHKLNEDWRVSARFNYSHTRDELVATAGARFVEGGVGFAWRPHDDARYALLGRYTYLFDQATLGQVNAVDYDQKSHVVSVEGVYKYDHRWEFAAKLAQRVGEARAGRGTGQWFDSAATLGAVQARYSLPYRWYALGEYRALRVKDGGVRQGWLAGVDRDIGKHLRVGVGYNFTDFSDDLTRLGYKYRGWYLNLVGTY
ncbi:hypothetical protein [Hydrogenophaga palleronii]|uniref:hypothetical protein n=1 Tax=Hydrogenophaga palleronii TaxID=65655 RepID=UPI0008261D85|nr:hypothetical protein [Hydrogenophaga palleronii]